MLQASIADLDLQRHYDSDSDDVMATFYRPLLTVATVYKRAVGYFSEQALKSCAEELAEFIERDGKIYLVVGCFISDAELASIDPENRDQAEQQLIKQKLIETLRSLEQKDRSTVQILGSLVASGVAELRFARRKRGIYHEKFGIFEDEAESRVAFIGSVNETAAALEQDRNHESFSVYLSTEPAIYEAYGDVLERKFDNLWAGRTKETKIYRLDEETLQMMRSYSAEHSSRAAPTDDSPALPRLAAPQSLREYQSEALSEWQANNYQGILAMATGTGKTITAIEAVKKFKRVVPHGAVVITVPYQNLAVQWVESLRDHGLTVEPVFADSREWALTVQNHFLAAQLTKTSLPCLVCVNNSFKSDRFQELLALLEQAPEKNHLIIVDECHHFNGPEHIKELPEHFKFRLGLSATPYDQFAKHYLDNYFGRVVFEFPLSRAISEKFLTPYRYHIIPVMLDADETEVYEEITRKIVQIAGSEDGFTPETLAKAQPLLLRRARIVGACKDKISALRRLLIERGREAYSLFYCGDGSVEEDGESMRQIERVSELLHELGWRSSRVTATESLSQREALLARLRDKSIDAIVSIKVLDEGIDVPVCRSAYLLASQSSDRQGIQRRGRVLRKSEGKDFADLFDFVVLGGATSSNAMRSLCKRELRRARMFAADSMNADSTLSIVEEIIGQHGLNESVL